LKPGTDKENKLDIKLAKCLQMQERAKKIIPGMTQLLSKRPDMFSLGVWPGYFSKAKGVEIWDIDGNKYVDMSISGIGANGLGYSDPDVDGAVIEAVSKGTSCSLNCPEEVELAELLCDLHPWAEMVRFARTGGESMSIAVRIARCHTGRDKVAFCGYHGWHDWYLAANLGTENALGEHLISGLEPCGVPRGLTGTAIPFHYNKLEELEAIVHKNGKDLAAIVMEPIRNDYPTDSFAEGIRSLADESGAVLIFDEISSGFRLNSGGAHLVIMKATPDIAVFSKAMGNGYPMAAVIGKENVMQAAQRTFISSTYWTDRIGPVAAKATIEKHRNLNAGEHLKDIGKQVQDGWRILSSKHGLNISIGGIFPLSHFSFDYKNGQAMNALFIQLMIERGFLASTVFYAMYAHQQTHVQDYLAAVDSAFSVLAEAEASCSLESLLQGKPTRSGFRRLN
jgi:glutamate-1-semialdehyde 2,1-aminomutase